MKSTPYPKRKVRSFVRRNSRTTTAQLKAFEDGMQQWGLTTENGMLNLDKIFSRDSLKALEIGFGSGYSLLAIAKAHPEQDFIGIETHKPGIGILFQEISKNELTNIRVFYEDAVKVLREAIPDESIDFIHIFFPDPWPKRRHNKRRLIKLEFVKLLAQKLKPFGTLHLATDWEDYAHEMLNNINESDCFVNLAGHNQFSERSSRRPVTTKFETRGTDSGRKIWELQFAKG